MSKKTKNTSNSQSQKSGNKRRTTSANRKPENKKPEAPASNIDPVQLDYFHNLAERGAELAVQAGRANQDSLAYLTYAIVLGVFIGGCHEYTLKALESDDKETKKDARDSLAMQVYGMDKAEISSVAKEERQAFDCKMKRLFECGGIALYLIRHAAWHDAQPSFEKAMATYLSSAAGKKASQATINAKRKEFLHRHLQNAREALVIGQVAEFLPPTKAGENAILKVRASALSPKSEEAKREPNALIFVKWQSGASFADLKRNAKDFFNPDEEKKSERGAYDRATVDGKQGSQISGEHLAAYLYDRLSEYAPNKKNTGLTENLVNLNALLNERLRASDKAENIDADGIISDLLDMLTHNAAAYFSDAPDNKNRYEKLFAIYLILREHFEPEEISEDDDSETAEKAANG